MTDAKDEQEWQCPTHGYVKPVARIHGGRGRAFECPKSGCGHTLTNTDVDWDAYHEARANGELPPCPRCGSADIDTIPAKPSLCCSACTHRFGYAGGYY